MGHCRLSHFPGAKKKVEVTEMSATTAALQSSPCYEIVVGPDPELDHEPRYNFMNEVDEIADYGTKLELTD